MKTLYSIILLMLVSILGYSQAPEAFNYQAVMRNASGDILTNSQIAVQVSILQNSESGTAVYVERFNPTTNDYGLIALKLGMGSVQSGTFNTIDWGADSYYIKIEVDPNNGTDFTSMGTSQLLSVPYALYAKSGGGDDADADPGNELQTLTIGGQNLSISDGNMVTLPPPADNSINSAMIIDGEVKSSDIATDAVGSDEIGANAVGSSEIATDAVGASEIAANAVGSSEIAADAVGASEVANGSLTRLDLLDEPAVREADFSNWATVTTSYNDLARITVTAPASGFLLVTASGTFSLVKNSGAAAGHWAVDLHTSPDAGPGVTPNIGSKSAARGWIQDTWVFTTEMGIPFHLQEVFAVSAGGTYSFYLNARATGFSAAFLFHPNIVALFIPSGL